MLRREFESHFKFTPRNWDCRARMNAAGIKVIIAVMANKIVYELLATMIGPARNNPKKDPPEKTALNTWNDVPGKRGNAYFCQSSYNLTNTMPRGTWVASIIVKRNHAGRLRSKTM